MLESEYFESCSHSITHNVGKTQRDRHFHIDDMSETKRPMMTGICWRVK